MRLALWLKVVSTAALAAALLSLGCESIDQWIRPNREILVFDLRPLVLVLVGLIGAGGGAIVAVVMLVSRSLATSLVAAVVISVTTSLGTIDGAIAIYNREDYFDGPFFFSDLVLIAMNLVIYPAVSFLLWRSFGGSLAKSTHG